MAIQTLGHRLEVMPHYSPVNPALASLNPNELTQGALAGLNISRTLEQLKADREHNEEFAKTHTARVKMAQAQSALEVLKLDHANAVRQAKIDADIAEHKLKVALAPSEEKATIAKNTLQAAKFGEDLKNVAPAATLAGLQIGQQTKDIQLLDGLRPESDRAAQLKAATDVIAAESAFNTAPALAKAAATTARGADARARLANNQTDFALDIQADQQKLIEAKLADDLKFATTDAEIRRAHDKADTALKLAQAKNYLATASNTDRGLANYSKVEAIENQLIIKEKKLWDSPVLLPNGKEGTARDYFAATRVPSGDAKKGGFLWLKEVPRNPAGEAVLEDIMDIKKRRNKLSEDLMNIDIVGREAPKEEAVKAGSIPPKGTKVKQGGVTYEFDGTSNIPKPIN